MQGEFVVVDKWGKERTYRQSSYLVKTWIGAYVMTLMDICNI